MAMSIERANSFHLMLSDDELTLLRLLAEREGLNASDYLRTLLRRDAGGSTQHMRAVLSMSELVTENQALGRAWAGQKALAKKASKKKKKK